MFYFLKPSEFGLVLPLNCFIFYSDILFINLSFMILLFGIAEYFSLVFYWVINSLIQSDQVCDNYSTHCYYSLFFGLLLSLKAIARLLVLPMACLLRFFTFFNWKMLWIWSIVLSSISNRLAIVMSKSSYSKSNAIIIVIIFQRFCPCIIAKQKCL